MLVFLPLLRLNKNKILQKKNLIFNTIKTLFNFKFYL